MTTLHAEPLTPQPDGATPVNWHRELQSPMGPPLDEKGNLPLSEFTADRVGAASPFGDDVEFPVNPGTLNYYHPGNQNSLDKPADEH